MFRNLTVLPLALLVWAGCGASTTGSGGPDDGEPCGAVRCGPGDVCVDGACIPDDACRRVTCDPGQVCSAGRCEAVGTDADGDGAFVEDDCDDHDPHVRPGSEIECSTECGSGIRTCVSGAWTACTAPTQCEPPPDPDAGLDASVDPGVDAAPPPPDPCEICDPEHHVAQANGEPCDCPETWRVVFADPFGAPISQVCRNGAWSAYNWNPSDPAACCAGVFAGCEGS